MLAVQFFQFLILVASFNILVQKLLLYLMGLPKVLYPSGRDFLLDDTVVFLAISELAMRYP